MCKLISMNVDGRDIEIAEIKKKYVKNIIDSAKSSGIFNKVMLFGSAIEERCTEKSDIDIALFGDKTEYSMLRSKEYLEFTKKLFSYDNCGQVYDILYFKSGKNRNDSIMKDIERGVVLYDKAP